MHTWALVQWAFVQCTTLTLSNVCCNLFCAATMLSKARDSIFWKETWASILMLSKVLSGGFFATLGGWESGRNNCVACVIFCRSTELECFAILTEQYDGLGVLQLEHTEGFARESQHAELFWTNAFHSWGGCAACNAHSTVGKAKPAMYGRFLSPRHKLLKDERIHNPLATKRSSSPRRDVVSFSSQPPRSAGDRWLWHYDNLISPPWVHYRQRFVWWHPSGRPQRCQTDKPGLFWCV